MSPKSKKLCSQNPTMDRISDLPNEMLHQILDHLPTKQAASTSILSKRWTHLWTSGLTNLDLNDSFLVHQETPNLDRTKTLFQNFVDSVLRHAELTCVTSFTLSCFISYGSARVSSWIQKACNPKMKQLDIFVSFDREPIQFPSFMLTSTSLVVLKLHAHVQLDIPSNGVCFPSLKVLNVFVYNQEDYVLTRGLCSRCPVLEDLVLRGELLYETREVVFMIVSSSLKRLKIDFSLAHRFDENEYCFKIRAENLESIDVNDDFLAEYIVDGNLLVLENANVCVGHPTVKYNGLHANRAFRLLGRFVQVKSLSLSGCTTAALSRAQDATYPGEEGFDEESDSDDEGDDADDFEDDGNMGDNDFAVTDEQKRMHFLPTFSGLTHLEFGFLNCSSWGLFLHVLEQSPNLEFLVFKREKSPGNFHYPNGFSLTSQESIPKCLLYHLKEIKIEGFEGQVPEMILVKFLLENAQALEKMTINSQPLSSYKVTVLREKVLGFPRGSKACQVELF